MFKKNCHRGMALLKAFQWYTPVRLVEKKISLGLQNKFWFTRIMSNPLVKEFSHENNQIKKKYKISKSYSGTGQVIDGDVILLGTVLHERF
jgi:hypothetical protein